MQRQRTRFRIREKESERWIHTGCRETSRSVFKLRVPASEAAYLSHHAIIIVIVIVIISMDRGGEGTPQGTNTQLQTPCLGNWPT